MSLTLFKIEGKEVTPTDDDQLGQDKIYIIIDKHAKRPKIWIWSGEESDIMDRYFAGVTATKIKSQMKLYGASIEVVESGNEPEHFPLLSKDSIIEPVKDAEPFIFEEEVSTTTKEEILQSEEKVAVKPKITEAPSKIEAGVQDMVSKDKVRSFFEAINSDLDSLKQKINEFLSNL